MAAMSKSPLYLIIPDFSSEGALNLSTDYQLPITNHQLSTNNYQIAITNYQALTNHCQVPGLLPPPAREAGAAGPREDGTRGGTVLPLPCSGLSSGRALVEDRLKSIGPLQ